MIRTLMMNSTVGQQFSSPTYIELTPSFLNNFMIWMWFERWERDPFMCISHSIFIALKIRSRSHQNWVQTEFDQERKQLVGQNFALCVWKDRSIAYASLPKSHLTICSFGWSVPARFFFQKLCLVSAFLIFYSLKSFSRAIFTI